MRVVIPGGSGLIGRALSEELSSAGYSTEILSRRPDAVRDLPEGVVARAWDGHTAASLAEIVSGATAVVNLIGENIGASRWTESRKQALRDSRIISTGAVVEAFEKVEHRPAVLLQASAVGFYGARTQGEVSEDAAAGDDFLGRLCQEWESESAGVEALGVRRVLLRTGIVLSKDGGALPRMALPFKMFAGGPIGSGGQCVPWIHLADEVGAIRFLLGNDSASGAYNLTAPEVVSNREFSRSLAKALGRPSLLPAPAFALKIALGEMSTLALDGQCAVPTRLLETGYEYEFGSLGAALQNIYG